MAKRLEKKGFSELLEEFVPKNGYAVDVTAYFKVRGIAPTETNNLGGFRTMARKNGYLLEITTGRGWKVLARANKPKSVGFLIAEPVKTLDKDDVRVQPEEVAAPASEEQGSFNFTGPEGEPTTQVNP
jgi:hypothetical protein